MSNRIVPDQQYADVQRRLAELEAVYASVPVGLALVDRELRYVRVNETLARINGRPVAEHIGRSVAEVVPWLGAAVIDRLRRVIETGEPLLGREMSAPAPDGTTLCWTAHWVPVRDADGLVTGASAVIEDTTARQRTLAALAERESDLRNVLDLSSQVPFVADADGRIVDVGARWLEWTGLTREQAMSDGWRRVSDPDDLPSMQAAWDLARTHGTSYEHERRVRFTDGQWHRVRTRMHPMRDAAGRVVRWYGTTEDVTDEARMREAERAATAALQRSRDEAHADAERVQLALAARAIVGTWDWDVVADRVATDDRFAESFGFDPVAARDALPLEQVLRAVHPDDLSGLREALSAAMARGGPFSHEYRVRGRDGEYRWVEANGRVDLASDGTPLRFPGVLLDVQERRVLEAERDGATALLRAFIEAAPGVIFLKDTAGRMIAANRGTAALIGKPPEAFLGRTDAEFLDDPAQAATIMANDRRIMEAGELEQVEEVVNLPDGTRAVWLSSKAPFRDAQGEVVGLVGASIDITARKDAENALHEADRRKDEFLAMLAHELRNPLAPITTAVRLLERETGLSAIGVRATEMIGRQSHQMRRLVDDLLEVSRISRGTIELRPEPIMIGSLVLAAVEAATPAAEAKRQSIEAFVPARPVRMVADPVRLAQVLENLVGNAIKYTPEGGSIRVDVVDAADAVELRVQDDGIGIAADKLGEVFELFVQAVPGVGPHQGGLGIGLALVRRLVALHGGTVQATSAGPGLGSTFVVRLPREVPARSPA